MRTIPLTQGKHALVSDKDYKFLSQWRWRVRTTLYRDKIGYVAISGLGKDLVVHMHRLILNAPKNMVVDHKNGNTLDNRRSNLRLATQAQNMANSHRARNNTSGVRGVSWDKKNKVWKVRISKDMKPLFIGNFKDKESAILARNKAVKKFHGKFGVIHI